jgi:hypothetical protein
LIGQNSLLQQGHDALAVLERQSQPCGIFHPGALDADRIGLATVIFKFDPDHPPHLPLHSLPTKWLSLSPAAGAPQVFAGLQLMATRQRKLGTSIELRIAGTATASANEGLRERGWNVVENTSPNAETRGLTVGL